VLNDYLNQKTDMMILNGAAVEGCSLVNLLHKHEVTVETHPRQYLKQLNLLGCKPMRINPFTYFLVL
jgi:hypothetical protein